MRRGFLFSLATALGTLLVTVLIILFAKGYWYNPETGTLIRTGLLAVSSSPTGASVFINDKLTDATNTTIKLEAGKYQVRIEKEGYQSWQKEVTVVEEMVTPVYSLLLPAFPELKPLTTTGAAHPTLAPDGTALAYSVPATGSAQRLEQSGVWVLNLNNKRPLGILRGNGPLQIAHDSPRRRFSQALLAWSPTGEEILAVIPANPRKQPLAQKDLQRWTQDPENLPADLEAAAWLLAADTAADRQSPQRIDNLAELLSLWKNTRDFSNANLLALYPETVRREATAAAWLKFAPDEKRFLYRAGGGNAVVVWKEYTDVERRVYGKPDQTFLPLKIEEQIEVKATGPASLKVPAPKEVVAQFNLPPAINYYWLPEGENTHIVMLEPQAIPIIEADGGNKTTVYTGELQENFIAPWPDGSRLIILTNLNRASGATANLYTLSLR